MDDQGVTLESGDEPNGSSLICHPERYLSYLDHDDHNDLSQAEKNELIQTLWNLLVMVSDLPIDFDPVKALFEEEFAPESSAPVHLNHPSKQST